MIWLWLSRSVIVDIFKVVFFITVGNFTVFVIHKCRLQSLGTAIQGILAAVMTLVLPVMAVVHHQQKAFINLPVLMIAVISFLKLVSFIDVTARYQTRTSLSIFTYFLIAPTLVYQDQYPMTNRIDVKRVLSLLSRLFIIGLFGQFLWTQWIVPVLTASVVDVGSVHPLRILPWALRLAVPCTLLWMVVVFYGAFHVGLNLQAELTFFGDRQFYRDWWNCSTVRHYWYVVYLRISCKLSLIILFPGIRKLTYLASSVGFYVVVLYTMLGRCGTPQSTIGLAAI